MKRTIARILIGSLFWAGGPGNIFADLVEPVSDIQVIPPDSSMPMTDDALLQSMQAQAVAMEPPAPVDLATLAAQSSFGIKTLQNMAAFMKVDVSTFASVQKFSPTVLISTAVGYVTVAEVILRDGRRFLDFMKATTSKDAQGAVIYNAIGSTETSLNLNSLKVIASFLKIELHKMASVQAVENNPGQFLVEVKLRDGKRFLGAAMESQTQQDSIGSIKWLLSSNVGMATLDRIAAYVALDPSGIASIQSSVVAAKTIVTVTLKDGTKYAGMLSPDPGYPELFDSTVYSIDWLVSSSVDAISVQNIAGFISVNPQEIASVKYGVSLSPTGSSYMKLVQVILKDNRQFVGEVYTALVAGTTVTAYKIKWLTETQHSWQTVWTLAYLLKVSLSQIVSITALPPWTPFYVPGKTLVGTVAVYEIKLANGTRYRFSWSLFPTRNVAPDVFGQMLWFPNYFNGGAKIIRDGITYVS